MGYKKIWLEYRGNLNTQGKQAGSQGFRVSSVLQGSKVARKENLYPQSYRSTRTMKSRNH